ncbi:MAG TPA: nuclear transport factor 2 family protein [Pyrinomonadaceae bacterium]|nr:nuclear transport factor 2 family protein [Pyrinomonadaceae bacterium]
MRKLFLVIGLITVAASQAFAQNTPKPTESAATAEESILQLTREWLAAEESNDRATLERIIADDFRGTAPGGQTIFKVDVIPEEGSQSGLAISASNLKARVFGDAAVVSANGVSKKGEKGELRFTLVFAKRNNRWQMVAGHLSAVLNP